MHIWLAVLPVSAVGQHVLRLIRHRQRPPQQSRSRAGIGWCNNGKGRYPQRFRGVSGMVNGADDLGTLTPQFRYAAGAASAKASSCSCSLHCPRPPATAQSCASSAGCCIIWPTIFARLLSCTSSSEKSRSNVRRCPRCTPTAPAAPTGGSSVPAPANISSVSA